MILGFRLDWQRAKDFTVLLLVGGWLVASGDNTAAAAPLDELMRTAMVQSHDLKAARAQIDAAMGRLKQAGLWPNPRLELSNETGAVFNNDGAYARSVAFAQDFPIAGRIGRAEDVARVDVARALAELNEAERKLLGDIATTYYTIAALDQKLAVRDRLIAIEASLVSVSAARYKAGEVSALDVNSATLELERLRQERTALAAERVASLKTLAGLVGLGPDAPLSVETAMPSLTDLPSLAELTDQALSRRPDLRLFALVADRATAEQALARASAWEDWTVSLGVKQDKLFVVGAPAQPADNALMMTVTVPFPLFNRNQGTQAAAAADEVTAREQAEALRLRIENEVAGDYARAAALADVVRQYKSRALPLGQSNAVLARDSYRKGQLSMTDVVQASRLELDLNNSYIDAVAEYLAAIAELNTAAVTYASLMTHPQDAPLGSSGDR